MYFKHSKRNSVYYSIFIAYSSSSHLFVRTDNKLITKMKKGLLIKKIASCAVTA